MKKRQAKRIVGALGVLVLSLSLLPGLLRAQGSGPVTLIALDPATGVLVPVELELVRRWDVRLDPGTGAVTAIGARPGTVGPPPLLAFDPSTRALIAVELVPVRLPGRIDVDPRTGAPSPQGLETRLPAGGPVLVGFDPVTGTLAPMEIALAREPGTFALDPRVGTLSPPARGPALVGFDAATGSFAPVEVSAVRGSGGLAIDPGTGQVSLDETAPAQAGSLTLLGVAPDGSGLVPVDLEVVYQSGLLTIDPGTGGFSFPGETPADAARAVLTMLGVHSPTGALMRGEVESVRRPGAFTVDLLAGTVEQVMAGPETGPDQVNGFVFGGGLDVRQMLKLQDVLAEGGVGATGASATELAPGIHGFAEYRWRAISVGIEAAYSVMDTEIRFPQGLQTGDLTYFEFGGNVKISVPLEGPFSPYGTVAILRARSEADFELEGLTEQRTYESKRDGIGAGFDYWVTPLWGFRAEGLYNTTFEDSDAAEHIRWRVAVTYSPSGAGAGR
jgi:hypothetical protein